MRERMLDFHEGGMKMKYSLNCPSPCNYKIDVDAQNDDEAVRKIMEKGKVHAEQAHPGMPPMTETQMKEMIRANMQRA